MTEIGWPLNNNNNNLFPYLTSQCYLQHLVLSKGVTFINIWSMCKTQCRQACFFSLNSEDVFFFVSFFWQWSSYKNWKFLANISNLCTHEHTTEHVKYGETELFPRRLVQTLRSLHSENSTLFRTDLWTSGARWQILQPAIIFDMHLLGN